MRCRLGRSWIGVVAILAVHPGAVAGAPAPPAPEVDIRYGVLANVPDRICVGTESVITVSVVRRVSAVKTSDARVAQGIMTNMPDVVVEASSRNAVVEMVDTTRVTWLDGGRNPPTARFRFRAKREGVATVELTARIAAMQDFGWAGVLEDKLLEQQVVVTPCEFDVSSVARFRVDGPAQLTFRSAITKAHLEQSDDGQFRQLARVEWAASVAQVGDCLGRAAINTSDAAIFATLEEGTLKVEIKYEPFPFKVGGNCGGFSTMITPQTVRFEVPATGAGYRTEQDITSPLGDAPGEAAFIVVPTDAVGDQQ